MNKKYNIIYANPKWITSAHGKEYGSDVLTVDRMCELPVKNIAAKSCALFLWVPSATLQSGFRVIRAWGFQYRTIGFVWVNKDRNGPLNHSKGKWTKGNTMVCLLAVKGNPQRTHNSVDQLIEPPIGVRFNKEDETRNRITALMGNQTKIELFALKKIPEWDVWGPDIQSDISFDYQN